MLVAAALGALEGGNPALAATLLHILLSKPN